ncbi:aldo/keto reductase [Thorsellia kenyensis]|uniref:Aldo/keto reductase family oxidoreductase n=1 Tax=Thorsellia kenyensis TaxID=1549888 RepID=A0ABV6CC88_9GAMM
MQQKFPLKNKFPTSSRIIYGCMGLGGGWDNNPVTPENLKLTHEVVETALSVGINFFDHADIYTFGKAEETFSQLFKTDSTLREKIILQSKCCIRFADDKEVGRYDASKDYIIKSVEGSLKRLGTEYLDILLLHRPDPLMEPDEIALAFEKLKKEGKVQNFGVSNMHQGQLALLTRSLPYPLLVNQLEMSLAKHDWVDIGTTFNDCQSRQLRFIGETIEYCRMNEIQLQAWGALANGLYTGAALCNETLDEKDHENVLNTKALLTKLAEKYAVYADAILIAWLLRHPAGIQPIIGTTNLSRIKSVTQALRIELSREDWYALYVTARGHRLP